ncbi:uncharacterized protein HD556DRAFT_1229992 [Suillus plorans]|uniref:CxC1-like cysteine cluster associated with KDZ transposases domain-containing protein n=1 Tax=Suillus plorans TaxID=116603 RepID=A0A9P7DQM5_9AGAM|nr:uncharacterized protein HD556DRAFT_1229992 [Suillus plorans]KAG1800752.1 hypothetical protein HD556DRAFT_1229992 [Suillus plorans]
MLHRWAQHRYQDKQTWRNRLDSLHANWAPLLAELTDTYLQWKALSSSHQDVISVDVDYSFTIPTIDIFTLNHEATIPHSADSISVVDSLLRAGYLSPTPITPTIVISLRTLEHYRLLHNRKFSLSIEAFAKVLCDSYSLPFCRRYRILLSDAFDVYLSLLRNVEKCVLAALGCDTPNWQVLNACPPCTYEVVDEPPLHFGRFYVLDGGNSAKRMASVGSRDIADTRHFVESDYLLPRDFIDTFTRDVHRQDAVTTAEADINDMTDNPPEPENPIAANCTKNWKATVGDEKKHMWGIFEEAGIFVAICRHGFLLWYADMV